MSRELKGLLRFAMEHSDGTSDSSIDPERAQWLKEALENSTVDLTKQLKLEINALLELLHTPDSKKTDMVEILDDIVSLTEDINLANDFFKLGGASLLHELLLQGPSSLKPGAYELLATVTQNNPVSQEICAKSNVLQELMTLLPREKDLECLKKLMLAISCLTRGYPPGVATFQLANGFELVLDVLADLLVDGSKLDPSTERVCAKGAFLVYSLLQEVLPLSTNVEKEERLATKMVHVAMLMPTTQEHLLAGLILLFSNSPSLEGAIDVENLPEATEKRAKELLSKDNIPVFVKWLKEEDAKVTSSDDPAHAELRTYLGTLIHLLAR